MSETVTRLRKQVIERVLHARGRSNGDDRRAAFDNDRDAPAARLISNVANHAYRVTTEDVESAKRDGLSEDAIFELVVCAAIGQAERQLASALAAVDEACEADVADVPRAGGVS